MIQSIIREILSVLPDSVIFEKIDTVVAWKEISLMINGFNYLKDTITIEQDHYLHPFDRHIFDENISTWSNSEFLLLRHVLATCVVTSTNTNSMLADILRKRKTEIDVINGAILTLAALKQKKLHVNEYLYNEIKRLEMHL